MASRLSDCLVRDGTLPTDVVRAALARQSVYGGSLDTALLEMGALDEPTLWGALALATGVPIPDAVLFENPDASAASAFDVTWSRRCRAVPVGHRHGTLQLCCSEPLDRAQLASASATLGFPFEVYVVPEVRLAAARQAVYGEPMPPRLLRVLAQLLGAQPVRRWVKALGPARPPGGVTPAAAPRPAKQPDDAELAEAEFDVPINTFATGVADILESRPSHALTAGDAAAEVARAFAGAGPAGDPPGAASAPAPTAPAGAAPGGPADDDFATAPREITGTNGRTLTPLTVAPTQAPEPMSDDKEEQLCLVADDAQAGARLAALRVLRTRLERPRVRQLADKLRADLAGPAERAVLAATALGELRDGKAVPELIEALHGPPSIAQTAERALVEIAQQDFGQSRKRWLAWWETHKSSERVDWLLEGLSHKAPEIRFSSSEELRLVTGEYFGYHFDLPKREREEARERWQAWWYQSGNAKLPDRR